MESEYRMNMVKNRQIFQLWLIIANNVYLCSIGPAREPRFAGQPDYARLPTLV
jgi:hypothetical protein